MLKLFRQAGMPRRAPPAMPACMADDASDIPRIASPLRNVSYALRPKKQETISLGAQVAADVKTVFWFDGNALIGSRSVADGPFAWKPSSNGSHLVRIVDDHGRAAERDVTITVAP